MEKEEFTKAIYAGDVDTVRRGLDETPALRDAPMEFFDKQARPIEVAAHRDKPAIIELLADRGSSVEGALEYAYAGSPAAASVLIKRGAMVDPTKPEGEINRYKFFIAGDTFMGEENDPTKFNALIARIKGDDKYRALAKKLPAETIKGGKINPEFLAFGEVMHQALLVSHNTAEWAGDRDALVPQLLDNSYQSNWQESAKRLKVFTMAESLQLKDALENFADVVVIPEMARKTKNMLTSGKLDGKQLRDMILPDVAQVVVEKRSLPVVFDLQRDWHEDQTTLEAAIRNPKYARAGQWLPFTKDFTASNGLTISFVTDSPTLEKLGKDEKHCVGGYSLRCMREGVHIGVVKEGDKILSTFEVNEVPQGGDKLTIRQHMFKGNVAVQPTDREGVAVAELVGAVRSGAIPVDFESFAKAREKIAREADDIRQRCGFDPFYVEKTADRGDEKTGPECETDALHAYTKVITGGRDGQREGQVPSFISNTRHSFVPGGKDKWASKTAKQFLEETGLMEKIDQKVGDLLAAKAERPPVGEGYGGIV